MTKYKKILITLILVFSISLLGCNKEGINESRTETSSQSGLGLQEGSTPPDFEITSTNNKKTTLASFSKEGKPVLVYFMATWCPYCSQDFKTLSKVYEIYEEDVPIIVMSLDLSENSKILSDYKSKYPTLEKVMFTTGDSTTLANYQVRSTTTKYAVSSDGKIIYKGSGAFKEDQWITLLDALKNA